MKLTIYSDGGSRGNPGICAYAIVVTQDGKVIFEDTKFLGVETNNYAEYRGLIAGIGKAIDLGADDVEFVMDFMIFQARILYHRWRIVSEGYRWKPLMYCYYIDRMR